MHSDKLGVIFVNGLNDGKTKIQDKIVAWWWRRRGIELCHAHVDWFDDNSVEVHIDRIKKLVIEELKTKDKVLLLGASAGGSLALNTYATIKDSRVSVVAAHARLAVGDYTDTDPRSLYRRAHSHQGFSRLFVKSVAAVGSHLRKLTEPEGARIMTLSSVTDRIVPPHLMKLDGLKDHRSFCFGHVGGWFAHLILDRDIIIEFASLS